MYRLKDSLGVFITSDNKLKICKYFDGNVIHMKHSELLEDLLSTLEDFIDFKSLKAIFPNVPTSNLKETIDSLIKLGIIEEYKPKEKKALRCVVIGCGTVGSHVFSTISMLPLESIVLIDDDIVEESNLYRQNFYASDLGKKKVDVLAKRENIVDEVIGLDLRIETESQLLEICRKYNINLIIQAADEHEDKDLCILAEDVANELVIPYIINFGYISNLVVMPEFFFPNDSYAYSNNLPDRKSNKLVKLITREKLSFRSASIAALLVSKKVENYMLGEPLLDYKKKGFFNEQKFRWENE